MTGVALPVADSARANLSLASGASMAKVVNPARSLPAASLAPAVPAGYKLVKAGPLDAPGGSQSQAIVQCPGSEVPVGGGAMVSPSGSNDPVLFASINSSYPLSHEWVVDVNTSGSSGADASFEGYAICVNSVSSYTVVNSGLMSNPAGASTLATATCPGKTALVGGGAFSSSTNISVNVGVDAPTSSTWRVIMNNGSAAAASVTAYAVCEKKPSGYSEPFTITTVVSGAETPLGVDCPKGTVPLSGGEFGGGVMNLDISSSFPSGPDWVTFMNDGDSNNWPFETIAVCAS